MKVEVVNKAPERRVTAVIGATGLLLPLKGDVKKRIHVSFNTGEAVVQPYPIEAAVNTINNTLIYEGDEISIKF